MAKVGYGRGYYGAGQLAPGPPRRRGGGWIKIAVVAGVGAAVWLMWPRKLRPEYDPSGGGGSKPPLPEEHSAQIAACDSGATLARDAQSRGYPSQQSYEDAVIASARQLQDAGARVSFEPHLQHLTPRLAP